MLVSIIGPNLSREDQAKGTFHVHRADCSDVAKTIRRAGGRDSYNDVVEVNSMRACAEYVYPVGEFEYWDEDPDSYIDDLWFAPCVQRELPRYDPSG